MPLPLHIGPLSCSWTIMRSARFRLGHPLTSTPHRFVSLLSRQLTTSLAAIILYENEVSNRLSAAAAASAALDASDRKFHDVVEVVNVGLYHSHPSGKITWANDMWHSLTGFPKEVDDLSDGRWASCIMAADVPAARLAFADMTERGRAVSVEMRLKSTRVSDEEALRTGEYRWILSHSLARRDEDGGVRSIVGCLTDFTAQKRAEEEAVERMKIAERLTEKLERFRRMAEFATVGM